MRASPQIEADPAPSFRSVVEPLEELQHRLSRVWSPVGHLNAVMNSEALRAAYNACLPLLSEYHTDLAQSERLYRAYAQVSEREGAALDGVQREVIEHALRDFRLAGRRAGAGAQGALQGRHDGAVTAVGQVRGERARCHQRLLARSARPRRARRHQ